MAINLNSDFRSKNRIYGEKGAFFAPNPSDGMSVNANGKIHANGDINTQGKFTSGGTDLLTIFSSAISGATGDSMLTFIGNLSSSTGNPYKPTGGNISVGIVSNPTFATVNATTFTGALNGNANTASTWQNTRTFTFNGDVTGSFATNGSADNNISLTINPASSVRWNSVYNHFNSLSSDITTTLQNPGEPTQGRIEYIRLSNSASSMDLANLGTTGSPTFSNITISNNATIAGNLSVQGNLTFLDTLVTLTSALSVVNGGSGPALFVRQSTGNHPIAQFIDIDGGQITFANDGKVSIGTTTTSALLNVGGNILATTATFSALPINTGTDTVIVSGAGGALGARLIDSRVWNSTLVNGTLTTNYLPKASGTNSLTNSLIYETTNTVAVSATDKWLDVSELRLTNSARTFQSRRDLFSSTAVATSGTKIPTFARTNLQGVKFFVSLIFGTTQTTCFEINATTVPATSSVAGTIFGIVDSSGTSQLVDADLSLNDPANPSNLVLTISSTNNSTTAIVDGVALYNTFTS